MNIKNVFVVIAIVLAIASIAVYLRDMRRGNTMPHPYTWLIWSITQGTASVAMWYGDSGWVFAGYAICTIFVFVVFLATIGSGYKAITMTDSAILGAAFLAIVVWWQLKQPFLSVLMVSAIDVSGYYYTYKKLYYQPWSETLLTWIGFVVSGVVSILAIEHYNRLTLTYIVAINVANLGVIAICVYRRRFIKV